MAIQTQNVAPGKDETPDSPPADGPLLDLNNAAVKRMIKESKKRGFVTVDELNAVLPSEEVTSEQIEDTMSMLNDMGINVVESDDADGEAEGASDSKDLVESGTTALAQKTTKREPADRTDDPVRMYLREMGTVELLSREGEIAIAKR
ncbi:MAG TPA: RNA polymerase sigma factor region1.1 domain-containing protein, partial [Afifellaceae bacterium]|nr:RNA polymerase sigma factor region1.1 domain-containing protein [Afifellaceae bacterium]